MLIESFCDVGLHRKNNEDSILVRPDLGLFAVADGMGGHAGGEVASKLCISNLEYHLQNLEPLTSLKHRGESATDARGRSLIAAVRSANAAVWQRSQSERELNGMATTVVALLLGVGTATVAHVGDSRAYLVRNQRLHPLTVDHCLGNALIQSGKSPADAWASEDAHQLTRGIGVRDTVQVDVNVFHTVPGDTLLVCSDGVHGYMAEFRILECLMRPTPAESIRQAVLQAGARDNLSAVVVRDL